MSNASPRPAVARPSASALREAVDGPDGFAVLPALEGEEVAGVRRSIEAQWLAQLRRHAPGHADAFAERGIERYHELSQLVDHAALWPKSARILPAEAVETIRATRLGRLLESAFGPFQISDEENLGREEIYWRIVRPQAARSMDGPQAARSMDGPQGARSMDGPQAAGDTGPVHADRWFWDLGHGRTPDGVERVKVWVAIASEPGLSGLRVVRGSHRREWRYHGELRDGFVKPCIDEDVESLGLELLATAPGDAVVFNDRLLHGGGESRGMYTRVSFEFTMFVRPFTRAATT